MKFNLKAVMLILGVIFIVIQGYRPNKNVQEVQSKYDFLISKKAPKSIAILLKNSCYDCHSNHTNYDWYDNIAPISWFVDNTIKNGKDVLNFSDWETTTLLSKKIAITAIPFDISKNKMPKKRYLLMKSNARMSDKDKKQVIDWIHSVKSNMIWDEP